MEHVGKFVFRISACGSFMSTIETLDRLRPDTSNERPKQATPVVS